MKKILNYISYILILILFLLVFLLIIIILADYTIIREIGIDEYFEIIKQQLKL